MKRIIIVFLLLQLLLSVALAENPTEQLQQMYAQAQLDLALGDYMKAADEFDSIGVYSDASQMAMYCKALYAAENLYNYDVAIAAFEGLGDYRDSRHMAQYYDARSLEAKVEALYTIETYPEYAETKDVKTYAHDIEQLIGYYEGAKNKYVELALFKDSLQRITNCDKRIEALVEMIYQRGLQQKKSEDYEGAISLFDAIRSYIDCEDQIEQCIAGINENDYQEALALMNDGNYQQAIESFKKLEDYKDSKEKIKQCIAGIHENAYQEALALMNDGNYLQAMEAFEELGNYKDSASRASQCKYEEALLLIEQEKYAEAVECLEALKGYKDSSERIDELRRKAPKDHCIYQIFASTKSDKQRGKVEYTYNIAYQYDKNGLLKKEIVTRNGQEHHTITYTYTDDGLLASSLEEGWASRKGGVIEAIYEENRTYNIYGHSINIDRRGYDVRNGKHELTYTKRYKDEYTYNEHHDYIATKETNLETKEVREYTYSYTYDGDLKTSQTRYYQGKRTGVEKYYYDEWDRIACTTSTVYSTYNSDVTQGEYEYFYAY